MIVLGFFFFCFFSLPYSIQNGVSDENVQANLKKMLLFPEFLSVLQIFDRELLLFWSGKQTENLRCRSEGSVSECVGHEEETKYTHCWCMQNLWWEQCVYVFVWERERENRFDYCSFVSPCSVYSHANGPLPRSLRHLSFTFIIIRFNC